MMQRKNKVKPTPITTIDDDNNTISSSSPSKPVVSSDYLRKNSDDTTTNRNDSAPLLDANNSNSGSGGGNNHPSSKKKKAVVLAKVKRNTWGTQPFDKYWLNLDCCGLVCATMTYMLHAYGVYSFGWILLPPWFSVMDEDGYRTVSSC